MAVVETAIQTVVETAFQPVVETVIQKVFRNSDSYMHCIKSELYLAK
jgi:hypothetical protein